MKITYPLVLCFSVFLVSCDPNANSKPAAQAKPVTAGKVIKTVTEVSHTKSGMSEVKKITADKREVIIAMDWRNYSAAKDGSVVKWYGDMSRPPAKYVVDSLTISIDGKGVAIPKSKYRYLASQWMNEVKKIGVFKQGKNLNVYVDLGDGAEAWTASYVIDLATGTLVSHKIHDGVDFHNQYNQ